MEEHQDQENPSTPSSTKSTTLLHAGDFEITIKVADPTNHKPEDVASNGHSHDQTDPHPSSITVETLMGRGIQRGFFTASHLANFLPTGTNLVFQALIPTIYKGGHYSTLSSIIMMVALGLCTVFCFISSFTDSVELPHGNGTVYGFVTSKGLWVYNLNHIIEEDRYKLGFVDVLHAVMSVVVFLAIALSDHRVLECMFSMHVKDVEQVMQSLVLIVGFVSSSLFLLFPVYRRGFIPFLPENVSNTC